MLLNRTPGAGLRGFCFAKAQPIRIYLFRTFYKLSNQEFFLSHQKTMQFTNIIKTTVIISLQASAMLLLISLKEKFGADRAKSGRKNRKEKCGKKIKGGNPRFEKIK